MKQLLAPSVVLILCALVMQWFSLRKSPDLPGFSDVSWDRVRLRSVNYAPFASSEPVLFETSDPQTIAALVRLFLEPGDEWAPNVPPQVVSVEHVEFYGPGPTKMDFYMGEYYLHQQLGKSKCMSRLFRNPERHKLYELFRCAQSPPPARL